MQTPRTNAQPNKRRQRCVYQRRARHLEKSPATLSTHSSWTAGKRNGESKFSTFLARLFLIRIAILLHYTGLCSPRRYVDEYFLEGSSAESWWFGRRTWRGRRAISRRESAERRSTARDVRERRERMPCCGRLWPFRDLRDEKM